MGLSCGLSSWVLSKTWLSLCKLAVILPFEAYGCVLGDYFSRHVGVSWGCRYSLTMYSGSAWLFPSHNW